MKVRCRCVDVESAPKALAPFMTPGQVFVTGGAIYTVYAMALFSSQLILQVVDDLRFPTWLPAWLFEVEDSSLPGNWVCTLSTEEPSMIQGPRFIAESRDSYSRMVELEDEQVQRFWDYVARQTDIDGSATC
jgi:hypothetical protein